jgi:hypothetical protein
VGVIKSFFFEKMFHCVLVGVLGWKDFFNLDTVK